MSSLTCRPVPDSMNAAHVLVGAILLEVSGMATPVRSTTLAKFGRGARWSGAPAHQLNSLQKAQAPSTAAPTSGPWVFAQERIRYLCQNDPVFCAHSLPNLPHYAEKHTRQPETPASRMTQRWDKSDRRLCGRHPGSTILQTLRQTGARPQTVEQAVNSRWIHARQKAKRFFDTNILRKTA